MNTIEVFLDGACHLCHFESRLIRKADTEKLIRFVNIAGPYFPREKYPIRNYNLYLQVRLPDGRFVEGVEGFAEIYKRLPKYRLIGRLLSTPVLREIAWVFYFVFAHTRKWLPERKSCEL